MFSYYFAYFNARTVKIQCHFCEEKNLAASYWRGRRANLQMDVPPGNHPFVAHAMEALNDNARLDRAVILLVCLVLALAVLYPQSFISHDSFLGKSWMDPLAPMIPLVAAGVVAFLVTRRRFMKVDWVDRLVLVFGAYMVAQNLFRPPALVSIKYVVLGLGVYYLVSTIVAGRGSLVRPVMFTLVGLALAVSLYGLLEFAVQRNLIFRELIIESVPDPVDGIHRIGSSLAHPVPFGVFLLQTLPFAALLLVISRAGWHRLLAWATLAAGGLALFFSFSKGSWIVGSMMAGGALLLSHRARNRKTLVPAVSLIVILVVVVVAFWPRIVDEIEGRSPSSISGREMAWRAAVDGIRDNPWGVGLFEGSGDLVNYIDPVWLEQWGQPLAVDNYYLCLALESGLAGFGIWAVMMVLIFREGFGAARVRGPSQPWAMAALAGIIGISLTSLTVDAFLLWPNYLIFWVSAGILHGVGWGRERARAGGSGE